MQQPKIILTVGASGSGKTSWTNQFVKDNPNFVNVNRDDIRTMFFSPDQDYSKYRYTKAKENLVTEMQLQLAQAAVDAGKGIVVSDTNLNPKARATWIGFAERNNLRYECEVFDEPVHILLKRNLERPDSRPVDIIHRMARQMREYLGKPVYDSEGLHKHRCVIFDIDGTLAHHDGKRSPYDYDKAIDDRVDDYMLQVLDQHILSDYLIIILTGREADESGKSQVTLDWLDKHEIPYDAIYCRAHGDRRSDAIVKEELFFEHIADEYSVQCIYDDRDQVVQMWRNIGVTCFQVSRGDF